MWGRASDQDVRRRPHVRKNPFDPGGVGILDPRRQFAVGKGPRAALPEMDVALRVQDPLLPEGADVGETLRNRLPPFEQKDGHPLRGERQGGEEPRRSAADDNRPPLRPAGCASPKSRPAGLRSGEMSGGPPPPPSPAIPAVIRPGSGTRRGAVRQPDAQQIDKTGRAGTPRIDRPPDHPEFGDRIPRKGRGGRRPGRGEAPPARRGRESNR